MQPPHDIKAWKAALRKDLLAKRRAVSAADRMRWNAAITQHLLDGFPQLADKTIGIYWPYQGEFDPRHALRQLVGALCRRESSVAGAVAADPTGGMLDRRSNAYVEAMNGLLQQAKRAARGFRTATHFIAIAYLRMSKLKHLPCNPMQPAMPQGNGLTHRCL